MKQFEGITHLTDNIIAGPCSAESHEQVIETARLLYDNGIKIFRAGIWKPRTTPGGFEGVGAIGLEWLQDVKDRYGMKLAIEVANPIQAKLAIDAEIDVLWIGARTTTDPFAVQDLANYFQTLPQETKENIHIMVKNPPCPDYGLWIGAIERIYNAGIRGISAIHRGFKTTSFSPYRNDPCWEYVLRFISEHPEIDLYCDPSHIAGKQDLVHTICYDAMKVYGCKGLMVECHCDPASAWTDASQQLKPFHLRNILESMKHHTVCDPEAELERCRKKIDEIDNQIVNHIIDRFKVCQEIGKYKKEHNINVRQQNRWNEVLDKIHAIVSERKDEIKGDLDYLFNEIYSSIHAKSIEIQKNTNGIVSSK